MSEVDIETKIILKTYAYLSAHKIGTGFREVNYRSFIEDKGLTEEYESYLKEKEREIAKGLLNVYTDEEKQWLGEHKESFKKKWSEFNEKQC